MPTGHTQEKDELFADSMPNRHLQLSAEKLPVVAVSENSGQATQLVTPVSELYVSFGQLAHSLASLAPWKVPGRQGLGICAAAAQKEPGVHG